MKRTENPIDTYLATVPPDHRIVLERIRAFVKRSYPSAEECLYYGMPAFRLNGKAFIAFRSSKAHCSIHPLSATVVEKMSSELASFSVSSGTIRFTPQRQLSESLLRKVLKCRAQELAIA